MTIIPGCADRRTVLGLNLIGDGLRDVLDPRLRIEAGGNLEGIRRITEVEPILAPRRAGVRATINARQRQSTTAAGWQLPVRDHFSMPG